MANFNFTFQPGTSLAQMIGFEVAGRIWSQYLQDDVTVAIHVASSNQLSPTVIGGAIPVYVAADVAAVQAALGQDVTSTEDAIATQNLNLATDEAGTLAYTGLVGDSEVQNSQLTLTQANAKALGLDIGQNAGVDGYIVLNTLSQSHYRWNYDFGRTHGVSWRSLDFLSVALHEVGHVLGFISGVDGTSAADAGQATLLDLFRYGDRSDHAQELTAGEDAYFSIDGGQTSIADFSTGIVQVLGGVEGYQASHWANNSWWQRRNSTQTTQKPENEALNNDFLANLFKIAAPASASDAVDDITQLLADPSTQASGLANVVVDRSSRGVSLGILDPTLAPGERSQITPLDILAFDVLGYDVSTLEGAIDYEAVLAEAQAAVAAQLDVDLEDVREGDVDTHSLTRDRWQDVLAAITGSAEVYERRRRRTSSYNASFWQEEGLDPTALNIISDGAGDSAQLELDPGSTWVTTLEAIPYAPLILRTTDLNGNEADDLIIPATDTYQTIDAGDGDNVVQLGRQGGNVSTGADHDTILAMGGPVNVAAGDGDNVVILNDERAGDRTVTTGTGHDYVRITGTSATVETGEGHDVVVANRTNTSTGRGSFTINAEAGNNTIQLDGGLYTQQTVTTGAGHDTLDIKGASATLTTGDGNDQIQAAPGAQASYGSFTIHAGDGDNLLQVQGGTSGHQTITTGSGDDQIHISSQAATVDTGAGHDVVVIDRNNVTASGGTLTVTAAAGDNHIQLAGGHTTSPQIVTTGDGSDTIALTGRYSTVVAGAGDNTVYIDGGIYGTSTIDTGTGNDTIQFTGGYTTLNSGDGDDIIIGSNTYTGTSLYYAPQYAITTSGGNNQIQLKGHARQQLNITTGDGNDVLDLSGYTATLNIGAGNNHLNLNGYSATVNTGTGNDLLNLSTRYTTVNTTDGDNQIRLDGGTYGTHTLTTGDGHDKIEFIGLAATLKTGNGDDQISGENTYASGSYTYHLDAGSGNNTIQLKGNQNQVLDLITGDGNDQVELTGRTATIKIGKGNDTLNLATRYNTIQFDNGSDENASDLADGNKKIRIDGGIYGNHTITTGNGDDAIEFTGAYANLTTGEGNDIIVGANTYTGTYSSYNPRYTVTTSGGDNQIQLKGHSRQQLNITTGDGNDVLDLSGYTATINIGAGNNHLNLAGYSATVNAGTGNDLLNLSTRYTTVTATDGDNQIRLDGGTYGSHTLTTGDGHDTIEFIGLAATLKTGDGDDQISGENTYASGSYTYHLDAGSGNNTIQLKGNQNQVFDLITGDGNDQVELTGRTATIKIGKGNDTLNLATQYNTIQVDNGADESANELADGNKQIRIDGGIYGSHTITTGNGGDAIEFTGAYANLTTGEGNDIIVGANTYTGTFSSYNPRYTVTTSGGDNQIQLKGHSRQQLNITTGDGNDVLDLSGYTATINIGAGNNHLNLAGYSATVNAGTGNDLLNLSTRYTTVTATDGDNQIRLDGGTYGSHTLTTGDGHDTIEFIGLAATLKTGDGDDQISGENTYASGSYTYHLDAGSGNNTIQLKGNQNQVLDLITGDGNDQVELTGRTATIKIGKGDDTLNLATRYNTIQFDNGSDENASELADGNKQIRIDGGIHGSHTITTGNGDDAIEFTGSYANLTTGEGNDIIVGANTYTGTFSSYNPRYTVTTSGGDNQIQLKGHSRQQLNITTGNGNDVLDLSGYSATLKTGAGHDILNLSARYTTVTTTDGDKQIRLDGGTYGSHTLTTGDGHDKIEFIGLAAALKTGAGDDQIFGENTYASGSYTYQLDAGNGDNTIQLKGNQNQVLDLITGDGNDQVELTGRTATIKIGKGDDTLNLATRYNTIQFDNGSDENASELADGNKQIRIDGGIYGSHTITTGNGDDAIEFTGGYTNLTTGEGNDIIVGANTYTGTSSYYNPRYTVTTSGGDNQIQLKGHSRQQLNITTGDGNDVLDLRGYTATINIGAGNNHLNLAGYSATVNAGTGNDLLNLSTRYTTVTATDGDNQIRLDGGTYGSHTLTTGDGHDKIEFIGLAATLKTGDGDDQIAGENTYASGSYTYQLDAGNGDNTIQLKGNQYQVFDLITGDGNDQVELTGRTATIKIGKGNDTLNLATRYNTIQFDNGSDENASELADGNKKIRIDGGIYGSHTITTGNGDDAIEFTGAYANLTTGEGNDTIVGANTYTGTYSSYNPRYTVTTSGGDNQIQLKGHSRQQFNIITGDGNDVLDLSGYSATVATGAGNDWLNLTTRYTTVEATDGDNQIHIDGGTYGSHSITTGGGNDVLEVKGANATVNVGGGDDLVVRLQGQTSANLGEGHDRIYTAEGHDTINGGQGNDLISTGAGNDVIDAGDGNDVIQSTNGRDANDRERDTITSGAGRDLIILGDRNQAYYTNQGAYDYAYLSDFSETDRLQLFGTTQDYSVTPDQLLYQGDVIAYFRNGVNFDLDSDRIDFTKTSDTLIDNDRPESQPPAIDGSELQPLEISIDVPAIAPLNLDFPEITIEGSAVNPLASESNGAKFSPIGGPLPQLEQLDQTEFAIEPLSFTDVTPNFSPLTIPQLDLPPLELAPVTIPSEQQPSAEQHNTGFSLDLPSTAIQVPNIDIATITAPTATVPNIDINVPSENELLTQIQTVHTTVESPTYSIVGGTDAHLFSIDTYSGDLGFNTTPDSHLPIDSNGDYQYDVIVRATLGDGSESRDIDTQHLTITFRDGEIESVPVDQVNSAPGTTNVTGRDASTPLTFTGIAGTADHFDLTMLTTVEFSSSENTQVAQIEGFELELDTLILSGAADQYTAEILNSNTHIFQHTTQGLILVASLTNVEGLDLQSRSVEYI